MPRFVSVGAVLWRAKRCADIVYFVPDLSYKLTRDVEV